MSAEDSERRPAAGPISDTWERGNLYERFMGRWSRKLAPQFLGWLACPPGLDWLDVGSGTGALSEAILDHCAPASVTGVEPSDGFRQTASQRLAGRAVFHPGNAAELPLGPAAVDAVVSGLVLNFVPDPQAALREMARVTRPGGLVGVYVWDYAGKMELLSYFWDAVVAENPAAAALNEGPRFPVCSPDGLGRLFEQAGLEEIDGKALEIEASFSSFAEYWQPFLGGQGPGPAYVVSLEPSARERLRTRLQQSIPTRADGSLVLTARAWGARGRKSGQPTW